MRLGRSHFIIGLNASPDSVISLVSRELSDYDRTNINDDFTWCKGGKLLTPKKCISISFTENEINISGWVKDPILGEMDLTGIDAMIPKKEVKKKIDDLVMKIAAMPIEDKANNNNVLTNAGQFSASPANEMMFCEQCGTKISSGAKFCKSCGNRL